MDIEDLAAKEPPRRRRRWPKVVAALVLLLLAFVASVPWLLSTDRARRWLLAKANEALKPGKLEVDRFAFSWFRPTRMDHFVIRDPQGDAVVDAKLARWDRTLVGILFGRPKLGTLHLEGTTADIERHADGTIDLVEALRPILAGHPETDWTIVADGALRIRSPELAEPIRSDRFSVRVRRPSAPGAVSWSATLADSSDDRSLAIRGSFDRWAPVEPEQRRLSLTFEANRFPLAVAQRGVEARTRLGGRLALGRENGLWSSGANLDIPKLEVAGDALRGDRLVMDGASARWAVDRDAKGLTIRSLDVRSAVGSLEATGRIPPPPGGSGEIRGKLDLAAIARRLPHALPLREGLTLDRGTAAVRIVANDDKSGPLWTAEAALDDLAGHIGETAVTLRDPATLSARMRTVNDGLTVDSVAVQSAFLNAEGKGDLDRGVTIDGTLDLAALARQVGDFVDLGDLNLDGSGRLTAEVRRDGKKLTATGSASFEAARLGPQDDPLAIRGMVLAGCLREDAPGGWRWEGSLAVESAERAGLALGAARLVARPGAEGSIALEPIDSTLNGGKLHVVPALETTPHLVLKIESGTELQGAEVNEEASRRVLSYVAPILLGGSHVNGRVSAKIDRAEIPLSPEAKTKTQVEGNVVFRDVEFTPGPVASDLLNLMGRQDRTLVLDQPVVLSIADGRVRQTGLAVPVGNVTKIEIAGDVGFDKSLDLRASLPLTPEMFPNGGLVGDIVAGTRITVPIGGTLRNPKIDREAFREELKQAGKELAIRGATRGAAELLFRLARPRDPNAPAPPTPAERREMRRERRMQRRGIE